MKTLIAVLTSLTVLPAVAYAQLPGRTLPAPRVLQVARTPDNPPGTARVFFEFEFPKSEVGDECRSDVTYTMHFYLARDRDVTYYVTPGGAQWIRPGPRQYNAGEMSDPLSARTIYTGSIFDAAIPRPDYKHLYIIAESGGPKNDSRYNCLSPQSNIVVLDPSRGAFTDHPVVPGSTPVEAAHFRQLRTRIAALRAHHFLSWMQWTDPMLTEGGIAVRAVHLEELRAALDGVYDRVRKARPVYTDASLAAGASPVRAVHVMELRAAIEALE